MEILYEFATPVYILKRHLGSIKEDHKGMHAILLPLT